MNILYKNIIDDEGEPGSIEKLIISLNDKAKIEIEEYESFNKKTGNSLMNDL